MTEPIKIGMAGIGRAGWGMHCEELKGREAQFQIVAACDLIPLRCEKMAERYQCRTTLKIDELVKMPEVELVDIATRSNDHLAHAVLALEAGKYVYLEKPICLSYTDALRLAAVAEKHPGRLFIRQNRRFDPDFIHVQEIIASGILGEVYEIRLARHNFQRRDDWQTIKEFGGGQLLNWGPHIVDHALRFLESPVESMFSDLKQIAAVGDAEDHIKIVLRGSNGRLVDLEISGGVALGAPTYRVFGTRGSLALTGREIHLKYLDPAQPLKPRKADPGTPESNDEPWHVINAQKGATGITPRKNAFGPSETLPWIETKIPVKAGSNTVLWDHLHAAIREGKPFPIRLDEVLEVMRVISAARKGTRFDL
ncbi:MAG TPA: Gfo/Idh/MocA family oxidoreductase [Anaerolineaceae bacterium]